MSFPATGYWQRRCWPCWRRHRDANTYGVAYDHGHSDGYRTGYANAARELVGSQFGPALLGDLVALCHPDRHPPERAEQANR
jgi:hypothetical protein